MTPNALYIRREITSWLRRDSSGVAKFFWRGGLVESVIGEPPTNTKKLEIWSKAQRESARRRKFD